VHTSEDAATNASTILEIVGTLENQAERLSRAEATIDDFGDSFAGIGAALESFEQRLLECSSQSLAPPATSNAAMVPKEALVAHDQAIEALVMEHEAVASRVDVLEELATQQQTVFHRMDALEAVAVEHDATIERHGAALDAITEHLGGMGVPMGIQDAGGLEQAPPDTDALEGPSIEEPLGFSTSSGMMGSEGRPSLELPIPRRSILQSEDLG